MSEENTPQMIGDYEFTYLLLFQTKKFLKNGDITKRISEILSHLSVLYELSEGGTLSVNLGKRIPIIGYCVWSTKT